MTLKLANCEEQYEKFPKLIKSEVIKLKEWYCKQPHLPNITGKFYQNVYVNNQLNILRIDFFFCLKRKHLHCSVIL